MKLLSLRLTRAARHLFLAGALALASGARAQESASGTEGTHPLSPQEALRAFHIKPGLAVELVAAEPLIQDPVAIDWGADGRLWVCEMHDYPSGMDQNWQPGGRIKVLEDANADGVYDRATVFLEGVPFPTGILAWKGGVLICAAPDILFAEDTNNDGQADRVEKLFTGFATDNYQARVNSLSLGLDNWIYGANGLLGGTIHSVSNTFFPPGGAPVKIDLRNRDFRFHPATGIFELAGGLTQQGRVRDDWGNWFGCDNSRLLVHFPYPDQYIRRNPQVAAPPSGRSLPSGPDSHRLFPASRTLERFNDPGQANRVTSAAGLAIYRDTLLGEEFSGNAFTCESVHNLVHREIISGELNLSSRRAPEEKESEFLSSTDNWFRPAQARTGPDGALYVVDIYRFLIEHPRWIPAARLAKIDIRAGADKGRIYRVRPEGKPLRPIVDLTRLNGLELAAALNSPNGTERDRVHAELLARGGQSAVPALARLARTAALAQVRVQALAVLEGLDAIDRPLLKQALQDSHPEVRKRALILAEPFLRESKGGDVSRAVAALQDDSSPVVVRQLAFTLGEDSTGGTVLAKLAVKWLGNPEMRAAILSSATRHAGELLAALLKLDPASPGLGEWIPPVVASIAASNDRSTIAAALDALLPAPGTTPTPRQLSSVVDLWQALQNLPGRSPVARRLEEDARLQNVIAYARRAAGDESAPDIMRRAAVQVLAAGAASESDLRLLVDLATRGSETLRQSALAALRRQRSPEVANRVLERWAQLTPAARGELLALLFNRPDWIRSLLQSVQDGVVEPREISLADRQRLATHEDAQIRAAAASLLGRAGQGNRAELLKKYEHLPEAAADAGRGAEIFTQHCASCHYFQGKGFEVGPDLGALRGKETAYWVKNILDPNAVIEPRFVNYQVETKDDRTLSGVIKNETATSLTVAAANGLTETILRSEVRDIRASGLSLMPEGLEEAVKPAQMADLIAYLRTDSPVKGRPDEVLRDPVSVARLILDASQPNALRETAVQSNPQFAAALVAEMTRALVPGTPEEYARIPWLWRVAIACGKRNDFGQIRAMLRHSLPQTGENLRDWQAVVIGGGIINGISQRGLWPGDRIREIIGDDSELSKRWTHALEEAARMTDTEKVPTGTRYDALRMIAMAPWETCGEQLLRYARKEVHPELQMGAVSGIADVPAPEAAAALVSILPGLTEANAKLAVAGLLRDDERAAQLLEALAAGRIDPRLLQPHREALFSHRNSAIREKARKLL